MYAYANVAAIYVNVPNTLNHNIYTHTHTHTYIHCANICANIYIYLCVYTCTYKYHNPYGIEKDLSKFSVCSY